MQVPGHKPHRVLNIFVLAMLNVSIMASLRSLPLVAEFGLSALIYFALVGIFFLIPSALVSAELATGWPKDGGVYVWVREALGDRWGFFAIWMQWVHNVAWYPVILTFVATTLGYLIDPLLITNRLYVMGVILVGFWGMTLLNFMGIRTSSLFSTIGVIAGTIIPGLFIIFLGVTWVTSGKSLQIAITLPALVPHLTRISDLSFLAGLFLAFAGLEVSACYASNVANPQKNYPRAIVIAAVITFFLFMLGALSIAVVIPHEQISLASGLMDAFKTFLSYYHLALVLPVLGALLIIGAIAEINAWIIGPVKGLYATSTHGNLPPLFQNLNRHGTPTHLLLLQAIIVTLVSGVFLFMPSVSHGFWILTALSAQIYLFMYILMFLSALVLRYTQPHVPRVYRIPYNYPGIWIACLLGIVASVFTLLLAFLPPKELGEVNVWLYAGFLIVGLFVMCAIPLVIFQTRKPSWRLPVEHLPQEF